MVLSHTSRFWCVDKDAFVKSPVPSKTLPGHSHGRILIPDPAETNYPCIFTRQRTTVVPEGDIPQYHMLGMVSRPKNFYSGDCTTSESFSWPSARLGASRRHAPETTTSSRFFTTCNATNMPRSPAQRTEGNRS